LGAQQLHALDKATELVLLAAELGKTERRLRETRGAFNALLNAAVDAIVVIDDRGIVITFNTAAEQIFGYNASEILGRNVSILMPAFHANRDDYLIQRYLTHREPRIIGLGGRESMACRRDGALFPVEIAVGEVRLEGVSRFVGIIRDVSARKHAESVIKQQQEELRLTFDSAPIGMVTMSSTGRFLSANRALTRLLGYSEAKMLSMNLEDVVHPDDADACLRYVAEAFTGQLENPRLSARFAHQNGKHRIGLMHSGLIRDSEKNPLRLVTQIEDITERVELENEARDHQQRLTHLNRLSTLGEMAAGIAHEINQPLTAIASYTQACQRRIEGGTSDRDKILSILSKVSAQALRAGDVIHRVRSLVKNQKSSQIRTDINKIVTDSVSMAKIDTRLLDCRLRMQLDPLAPPVLADSVQIQQILLNLIGNALDAMESVSVDRREILISTSGAAFGEVKTTVADRGEGLLDEVAEQLFNPFFTTKERGMGMGLSISRSIIAAHGGRLWFSDNPAGGTVFHFTVLAVED
jgi:two-component system sensor kinase FixL